MGTARQRGLERLIRCVAFQTVHPDLCHRDVPAQPSLIDLTVDGQVVPALVMPTKQGDLYVLDRRSGRPILPVRELPAPASTVPGEFAAPTQPQSSLSFMPPTLTGKDMWSATPLDQLICRIELRRMGYDGPYTPPSTRRTLVYPGNLGVFNWGGVAVDPVRQIMVGTPAFLAFTFQLIPRPDALANVVSAGASEHWNENRGTAYAVKIGPFLSPIGPPCQALPWGAIAFPTPRTCNASSPKRMRSRMRRCPQGAHDRLRQTPSEPQGTGNEFETRRQHRIHCALALGDNRRQ